MVNGNFVMKTTAAKRKTIIGRRLLYLFKVQCVGSWAIQVCWHMDLSTQLQLVFVHMHGSGADPGLGGACIGEGSGDLLRSPAGSGPSPSRGSRGTNPTHTLVSSGGLRNYRHLFEQFWTNHTIFIRPKKLYFES